MKRFFVFGAAFAALSGCLDKDPAENRLAKAMESVASIETFSNSPDAAVKSWWRIKDASALASIEVCKNNQRLAEPVFKKLSTLSDDDFVGRRKCGEAPLSFDRQITKVEVQSETRAVVFSRIKNITPSESGSVLNEEAKKAKDAGEPFQYVLERKDSASGWKITKIASVPFYATQWRDVNEKPTPSTNQYVYGSYQ